MEGNHLLHVYSQLPVQFEHGEGPWLYDNQGNKYLDAYCGIAVTGLGHNYPAVTKFIHTQAAKVLHLSNVVEIPQQIELSNVLAEVAGFDCEVFFNNSGAEAVETAIKLARLYGHSKNITNPKIIVMSGAFHGRTMATISASANPKAREGFEPLLSGFVRVQFNDVAAIEAAVKLDKEIVAVLVEPIQGESGVNPCSADYLPKLRALCDEHGLLMLLDEVQCGMGRTGKFFYFQHTGVVPDAVTMAKGLANGVPIGACIVREPHAGLFKSGSHGSTFGGNPLSCGAGVVTVKEIMQHKFYENAAKQGEKIIAALSKTLAGNKHVKAVRGKGLMIGIELDQPCREILNIALKHRIIFNVANLNTLRLLPPLIIDDQQTKMIIDLIPQLIDEYYATVAQ